MKNLITTLVTILMLSLLVTACTQQSSELASNEPLQEEIEDVANAIIEENDQCICTMEYAPVCGEDGKTYSNRCQAGCADVEVKHLGPCEGDTSHSLEQ